jgi:hypothetical protein
MVFPADSQCHKVGGAAVPEVDGGGTAYQECDDRKQPTLGGSPVLDGIGGRRLEDALLDESKTSEGRMSTRRQIFSEPHDVPASPFFIVEIITSLPKATYNFGIASPPHGCH